MGGPISFDTFLVSVGDFAATAEMAQSPEFTDDSMWVVDLTQTDGPLALRSYTVTAGQTYSAFDYDIAASADAEGANATADDLVLMVDNGYAVYVEGTATDGTTTVSFAWGFAADVAYADCHSSAAPAASDEGEIQMTIHGDHLFYDDLAAEEPSLRFATLAAADDGDGVLTLEELAAVSGTDFQALDNYGVGDTGIDNLRDYVTFQVGTLGHIDGEGHCN